MELPFDCICGEVFLFNDKCHSSHSITESKILSLHSLATSWHLAELGRLRLSDIGLDDALRLYLQMCQLQVQALQPLTRVADVPKIHSYHVQIFSFQASATLAHSCTSKGSKRSQACLKGWEA